MPSTHDAAPFKLLIVSPRTVLVVGVNVASLCVLLGLWLVPLHDSWFRSPAAQQAHALEALPRATMLQAADDSCDGDDRSSGHFATDERYGYWVQDFQGALQGPNPAATFHALLTRREPLAQLYALTGLALVDSVGFRRALASYTVPDTVVLVADGCVARERRVADILPEIARGYWPAAMTRRTIDVH